MKSLHITSGYARGIQLKVPDSARPMMNFAKSALFSIIQSRLEGAKVLDIYAGSGALGLETISRGARYVKFIEITKQGIECIKENAQKLKVKVNYKKANEYFSDIDEILATNSDPICEIIKVDAMDFLEKSVLKIQKAKTGQYEDFEKGKFTEKYNIIFVCPPHVKVSNESVRLASNLLESNGILIAESPVDIELSKDFPNLEFVDIRRYGRTNLYFYLNKF